MIIYQNNDITIDVVIIDEYEAKVNINGQNLIYISRSEIEEFKEKLSELLDNHRI